MSADGEATGTVLVVDDVPANISVLLEMLGQRGYQVLVARDGESALEQSTFATPDLILLDIMMPGLDGFETCRQLKARAATREVPVIFMTALSDTVDKVRGFNAGAIDYITKPFQHDEVLARVHTHLMLRQLQVRLHESNERLEQRVIERTTALEQALAEVHRLKDRLQQENFALRQELRVGPSFDAILGNAAPLRHTLDKLKLVAPTRTTVLIHGESGTGKELMARALHELSPRAARPLIKVNCAAISAGLVESELFGHEKGAFTGATERRLGRFEIADGGTLFLDEVGELPLETQAKLLRVLQENEFERVGSGKPVRVDVRVVAATNRNLAEMVEQGKFRRDLFFRLNVFPLDVPPLRAHPEDIPLLVDACLVQLSRRLGKALIGVSPASLERMRGYAWPGNVRELHNVLERAAILAADPVIELDGLLADTPRKNGVEMVAKNTTLDVKTGDTLENIERLHIERVLEQTGYVIEGRQGAALILGLPPGTLRSRMKKLNIRKPSR